MNSTLRRKFGSSMLGCATKREPARLWGASPLLRMRKLKARLSRAQVEGCLGQGRTSGGTRYLPTWWNFRPFRVCNVKTGPGISLFRQLSVVAVTNF